MQEIYVVKLKSRPERGALYPSERRYSASTAGGLGLVHGLLSATLLVLAALGMAAEPVAARPRYVAALALGLAAAVAAAVAVLAWRRWYVDNNIRHFLVAAIVAGVVAVVCLCVTSVSLATVQEEISTHYLRAHRAVATPANATDADADADVLDAGTRDANQTLDAVLDDANDTTTASASASASAHYEERSPWIYNYESFQEIRHVVLVNVLVAAALELAWCLLSAHIAWRGVRNAYSDADDAAPAAAPTTAKTCRPPLRSPDIIRHLAAGARRHGVGVDADLDLPKGESSVEYEERVRRFLAASDAVEVKPL